jgi:methionine synthase I (cobalamin-dependent)/protein-tyrosine-phosphatase
MAAAFFNQLADPRLARAVSAGTRPAGAVHPGVVSAMREVGVELSAARPRRLDAEILQGASLLVTMGCGEACPAAPGAETIEWSVEDPAGRPEEDVRRIREDVAGRVRALVEHRGWARSGARDLVSWIRGRRVLVADGAMGTELIAAGLPPRTCPEAWVLDRPEVVAAVHRAHLDAGAELLETNTFGASPMRLASFGLTRRTAEINRAGAALARSVAGDRALVLGSMGPSGTKLASGGPLAPEEAAEGFRIQAGSLAEGGADGLIVETMTDLEEAVAAVRAAAATGLPVVASMTFGAGPDGGAGARGADPAEAARALESAGASAVGTNCGTGPAAAVGAVRALAAATPLPVVAKPSAGTPAGSWGSLVFPETPASFASHAAALVAAGAAVVGGCCGATPDHVRALAREIRLLRATGRRSDPR